MLGSLILYLKGMRIMMFQLSGFYCKSWGFKAPESVCWSLGVAPNTKGLGCGAAYVMRIFGFRVMISATLKHSCCSTIP